MKTLKIVGIIILSVIALVVVVGLFLPKVTTVERSIVINATEETVFTQVNVLQNWEKWSPWYRMDTAKITYSGPASGNGASFSWDGKKTDKGTLTLSDVVPNKHITENMVFNGNGEGKATMDFSKEGNGTKVVWKMEMDNGWNPLARIFVNLFVKGMLDKQFEDGLNFMKEVAERAPVVSANGQAYVVQEIDLQPGYAVAIEGKETDATFTKFFAQTYPSIAAAIVKGGGKIADAPFSIIYNYVPGGITSLAAAMAVDKKIEVPANMKLLELKASKAAKVTYYGDYKNTGVAHEAIDKWVKANKRKIIGPPIEKYTNDPGIVKDTAKWETEIIYPIQ